MTPPLPRPRCGKLINALSKMAAENVELRQELRRMREVKLLPLVKLLRDYLLSCPTPLNIPC